RAARELVSGSGGRIVLLSDGVQTQGDALAAAQALGVPVDTLAYQPPARPEIWVAGVDAPRTLREGEEDSLTVGAGRHAATPAGLTLDDGASQLAAEQVRLPPGENRLTYHARAGKPGILRLHATLDPGPPLDALGGGGSAGSQTDTFAQNNTGAATALVAPRPRVLLVESRPGAAAPLRAALRPAGVEAETTDAKRLPARLSDLADYQAVVL